MKNDTGVSMREFARQVGRSAPWVRGKCKAGELPLVDGKVPLEEGIKAFKALIKANQIKKAKRAVSKSTAAVFADGDEGDQQIAQALNLNEELKRANVKKEIAIANLKTLELQAKKGEYIPIAEVEADAREFASILRNYALSAPARYSALLENRSQREAEGILEDIFHEMLELIHKSEFVKE